MNLTHPHNDRTSTRALVRIGLAAACAGAAYVCPSGATAQALSRFALRAEVGAGTMVATYQTRTLGYSLDMQGSVRLAFNVVGPLTVQASFSSWYFPSYAGDGQQYSYLGGVRIEPMIGSAGHAFLEANAGVGQTADRLRFALDLGLGFEFRVCPGARLGPVVRYGWLFASGNDLDADAEYWSVGLSLAVGVPPPTEPASPAPEAVATLDTDHDGVADADDQCPLDASGAIADPGRRGCPMQDADGDGVSDAVDACPHEAAAGDASDPARPGCPAPDRDGDGVLDRSDACPDVPQGNSPDPQRPGCPDGDDDGDGVTNHQDACPNDPMRLAPDPARRGCPLADRDADWVPDVIDACPAQPGAPAVDPRRAGCPGLLRMAPNAIDLLQPVRFVANRDAVARSSENLLRAIADALTAQPLIRRVSISVRAETGANAEAQSALALRRATAIVQWLTAHGVDSSRLEPHTVSAASRGPDDPAQLLHVRIVEVAAPTAPSPAPASAPSSSPETPATAP